MTYVKKINFLAEIVYFTLSIILICSINKIKL